MPRKLKHELPPLNKGEEAIGQRLAQFRKEKLLTQAELAQKIGITQTLVSDYETGRVHLSDTMIIRFAITLDKSTDEILGFNKGKVTENSLSLRFMKRFKELEKLPKYKQKSILQTLDSLIRDAENSEIEKKRT